MADPNKHFESEVWFVQVAIQANIQNLDTNLTYMSICKVNFDLIAKQNLLKQSPHVEVLVINTKS